MERTIKTPVVKRRKLGHIRDVGVVYEVDGERLRNETFTDWTMGGSEARYAFIPKGEIWIEDTLSPFDQTATALHEAIERFLMLHDDLSYSDAHDAATIVERAFRTRLLHRGALHINLTLVAAEYRRWLRSRARDNRARRRAA